MECSGEQKDLSDGSLPTKKAWLALIVAISVIVWAVKF